MTFPLLVAGIILRATSGWFHGQHTTGDICMWVGGGLMLLQLLIVLGVIGLASQR